MRSLWRARRRQSARCPACADGVDLTKERILDAVIGRFIGPCCGFCSDACGRRLRTRVVPGLQHNEPSGAGERRAPRLDEAIAGMVEPARLLSQTRVEQR